MLACSSLEVTSTLCQVKNLTGIQLRKFQRAPHVITRGRNASSAALDECIRVLRQNLLKSFFGSLQVVRVEKLPGFEHIIVVAQIVKELLSLHKVIVDTLADPCSSVQDKGYWSLKGCKVQ